MNNCSLVQAAVCHILLFLNFSIATETSNSNSSTFCFWTNFISNGRIHYMFLHRSPSKAGETSSLVLFDSIWTKDDILVDCVTSANRVVIRSYMSQCWEPGSRSFSQTPDVRFNTSRLVDPAGPCEATVGHLANPRQSVRRSRDLESVDQQNIQELREESSGHKMRRSKRAWVVPGTLWCGAGHSALDFTDLGMYSKTDMCCREHDHCQDSISSFGFNYGVLNTNLFTLSHCDCDNKFRRCLHNANDSMANVVGYGYFNILKMRCFEFAQRMECAERTWWGMCKFHQLTKYAVVKDATYYNSTSPELEEETSTVYTMSAGLPPFTPGSAVPSTLPTDREQPETTDSPHPKPTDSKPTDLKPTDSPQTKPTDSKPTDLKPTDSPQTKPTDSKPTDLKPTDSPQTKPTDSKATDSPKTKPTDSKPTDSEPTDSKPTDSEPTNIPQKKTTDSPQTKPTDSKPTDSKPTDSKPTDSEPTDSKPTDSPQTKPTDSEPTDKPQTKPTDSPQTETTDSLQTKTTDSLQTKTTDSKPTDSPLTETTDSKPTDSPLTETTDSETTDSKPTDSPQTNPTDSEPTDSSKTKSTDSPLTETTDSETTDSKPTDSPRIKPTDSESTDSPQIKPTDSETTDSPQIKPTDSEPTDSPQTKSTDSEPKTHLQPGLQNSNTEKGSTCESYKALDSCRLQIPGLQEKFGLRNAEFATLYHCNCTARLASQFSSLDRVDDVHFFLLDFVSQFCFILPPNCIDSESCSSTETPLITRWTKDMAGGRHLVASKRKAKRLNSKRAKRKDSFRLYKKCLRMHSKLQKPKQPREKLQNPGSAEPQRHT